MHLKINDDSRNRTDMDSASAKGKLISMSFQERLQTPRRLGRQFTFVIRVCHSSGSRLLESALAYVISKFSAP